MMCLQRKHYAVSLLFAMYTSRLICAMQVRRAWTTKDWCESVVDPEWPFAYSKYAKQTEETKGRVSTNRQDVRHQCNTRGVQSKCHRCEDIACGDHDDTSSGRGTCHFQLQGVSWEDMSKNIPTVSDVPWAVGGSHRYDFGGNTTTHVCMYLSGTYPCQSSYGEDYSKCDLRCWGHGQALGDAQTDELTATGNTDDPARPGSNLHSHESANATPWIHLAPTESWSYSRTAPGDVPLNPFVHGTAKFLPQGFTYTLAGSSDLEEGFVDGVALQARFHHPEGVAVDHDGYVYVADTGNHAIRMISPAGTVTTIAGTGKAGSKDGPALDGAEFSNPSSLAVWRDWQWWPYEDPTDPDSFLYRNGNGTVVLFVADTANHRIRKITGKMLYSSASGEKTMTDVLVECFSGVCGNHAHPGFSDGTKYEARFDSPRGITASSSGEIFVSDTNNHLIRAIDKMGVVRTIAGSVVFSEINDIGEPLEGCSKPCLTGVAGFNDGSSNLTKFTFPSDIALGVGEYQLFVTDQNRLRVIDLMLGYVVTIVGSDREGERDGNGNDAQLNMPDAVTVTSDGSAYIADSSSCRIRRVSPAELIVPKISCSDTLSALFRPSGCSSYNAPIDESGMKATSFEGNIYYNYKYRYDADDNLGEDYIGRGIKDCVGSPPAASLDKKRWNTTSDNYPYNENLVIDDHETTIREDPNEGSLMKVACPSNCSSTSVAYGIRPDSTLSPPLYLGRSSVCAAALHSGIIHPASGGFVNVILNNEAEVKSLTAFNYSMGLGERQVKYHNKLDSLFTVSRSNTTILVSTIAGSPATVHGTPCGYDPSFFPQEAKFGTPTGIAAFVNSSLEDNIFLFVADRNNNQIRAISSVCTFPCENGGRCVGPDQCKCLEGWTGIDCSCPMCELDCKIRELCVAPDTCKCIPGYFDDQCSQPICVQVCQNGGKCFAPDTCSCAPGWFDANCSTPVCEQTCGNDGNCTAPNKCSCPADWTGRDCRVPVCEQNCSNGGWCVAPNTCACPPLWSGYSCANPVCHQGFFVPNKIPTHWIEYRPCDVTKWCEETQGFDCKQDNRTFVSSVPLYGQAWRHITGQTDNPGFCLMMEIRVDALTMFQYIDSWDNSTTPYYRYTPQKPYEWKSNQKFPWDAVDRPADGLTQPWRRGPDRQVALMQLYEVSQGVYSCANSGSCIAPDTCACAKGWIGFDCRVPVCEQGFYESDQVEFVKGTNLEGELSSFEAFLSSNQTVRLDPYVGYSNPMFEVTEEKYTDHSHVERRVLSIGEEPYKEKSGSIQGGYSCSIRSISKWEDYRSSFLLEHPNYYSRYMDAKTELDDVAYTYWKNMGWAPTYRKSSPLEIYENDLLHENRSNRKFVYTDNGYRLGGVWTLTGSPWKKGHCIIEFQRVCKDSINAIDLESGLNLTDNPIIVQDTDKSFRPRVHYDNQKEHLIGTWVQRAGECTDHVIRGCFNNGTCIGPNQCQCAAGWTGFDCRTPICSRPCLHNGNCTLPDICTCEKGWAGQNCTVPLCAQECNNFGKCIAPDTCQCKQWPNNWRDGQSTGGVPLYQTSNGDPQMTGWTGYDCSTPICVQAETFRLNVDLESGQLNSLVTLGGHGMNGKLECTSVRCPTYDETVLTNDGRSFQTGCGFDPIETGCCYAFDGGDLLSTRFKCFKCKDDELRFSPHASTCSASDIVVLDFPSLIELPSFFRQKDKPRICGEIHNPGLTKDEYFTSDVLFAGPELSNNNWNSTTISDRYLCNRYEWEQGSYVDDAVLINESGVGSDLGLASGRHIRINANNYVIKQVNPLVYAAGPAIRGEGIFQCYNFGSCIAPDTCTCRDGYSGFDCRTPLCRHKQVNGEVVGCLHGGICQDKDECRCIQTVSLLWKKHKSADRGLTGWTGTDCSTPICVQGFYDPSCENISTAQGGEGCFRCPNAGLCVAPDVCQCSEGWTGFDCQTPICEASANNLIRSQLMTFDELKIHIFETDPCGLKGFHDFESTEYYRGTCTLPNQCTCVCHNFYDRRLCDSVRGKFCITPFHDPLFRHRRVLSPNEIFGTRSCYSGYEGLVDEKDAFRSCHLTIYEPDYATRNSVKLLLWGLCLLLLLLCCCICIRRRLQRRRMLDKIENRNMKRANGNSNNSAFQYLTLNREDDLALKDL